MQQVLGIPWQSHPLSTWQVGEQPSPALVLPSSQVSPASRVEFPQAVGGVGGGGKDGPQTFAIPP